MVKAKKTVGKKIARKRTAAKNKVRWEDIYELEIVKKARAWNRTRDVDTIEGINRRMEYGGYREVIRDADRAYEGVIWKIAADILENRDKVRLVVVAGPSSSGKTTTTMKLCDCLRTMGDDFQLLSLDNYFWNLKDQPCDEFGDYNFETPHALDKETINQNLKDLLGGREAPVPIYDFMSGRRERKRLKMKLAEGQLLVVEGLHAFWKPMTAGIPKKAQFRVYIEAVCQLKDGEGDFIPWTDIRLLRRMVRDSRRRNYTPLMTLAHWHYVREAEKEYIVPFIEEADAVVNGYLPYELPVHKKYLYEPLKEGVERFGNHSGREDAYRRAVRCLGYLQAVNVLEDDSVVPPASLLREFIGGSVYEN